MKMLSIIVLVCSFLPLSAQYPIETKILTELTANGYSAREAQFWVKVSKVETDNYKSLLFVTHNNMWGMNYVRRGRPTTCLYQVWYKGKKTRFAGFRTPDDGIKDLVYWLEMNKFPKDFKDTYTFCKYMKLHKYFEEPFDEYYNNLKAK